MNQIDELASGLEPDTAGFRLWLCHEFTNGFEDDPKLGVVLFLQFVEATGKDFIRADQLPEANKCPHDGDVYLYGTFAM